MIAKNDLLEFAGLFVDSIFSTMFAEFFDIKLAGTSGFGLNINLITCGYVILTLALCAK
jgi:hypothetical protein